MFLVMIVLFLLICTYQYISSSQNRKTDKKEYIVDSPRHDKKKYIVSIEGNIGAGKTRLCRLFESQYASKIIIMKEEVNTLFLDQFYRDGKKYGFAMQMCMLKSRIFNYNLSSVLFNYQNEKQYAMMDRSMFGDLVFATANHHLNNISNDEFHIYKHELSGDISSLDTCLDKYPIDLFIYLDQSPELCYDRVVNMRKNHYEKDISLSYFKLIDDIHFAMMLKICSSDKSRVIIHSPSDNEPSHIILQKINQVLNNEIEPATVEFKQRLNVQEPSCSFIYDKSMIKKDGSISVKEHYLSPFADHFKNIYIPSNFMINQKIDHHIPVYDKSIKKMILKHLSMGQKVIFFDS